MNPAVSGSPKPRTDVATQRILIGKNGNEMGVRVGGGLDLNKAFPRDTIVIKTQKGCNPAQRRTTYCFPEGSLAGAPQDAPQAPQEKRSHMPRPTPARP